MCVRVHTRKLTFTFLQTATVEPQGEQLVRAIQAQNPLGTSEHIAVFVVNTLFSAIVEATTVSVTAVPEKMRVWFKAYR